jgi:hypothetical protein
VTWAPMKPVAPVMKTADLGMVCSYKGRDIEIGFVRSAWLRRWLRAEDIGVVKRQIYDQHAPLKLSEAESLPLITLSGLLNAEQ